MSSRALALDLTRLWTRLGDASPSGIDRVELAYARHFLAGDGPRFGLVSTAFGPRVLDRRTALALAETVAAGWVEDAGVETDPVYRRLAGLPALSDNDSDPDRHRPDSARRLRAEAALRLLRARPVESLPRGTLYLHASHLRLEQPQRFDWLHERPDIRAVFVVHDLIPILAPEYCRPGEAARHAARMRTVARHAAHILAISAATARSLTAHLAARGFGPRPTSVVHLGIEPVFSQRAGDPPVFERPTFLVCGTIEPRKNHLLLLDIWRRLAERGDAAIPRLLVVGRRGWEAEGAFAMLDRCPGLKGHVEEVTGLTTPGLARLMRGASALLMPSFAEGYGLPVLEAAASGVPVVASDIPVHRETAGGFAHLLDPNDGLGWMEGITALAAPDSALRADLVRRLSGIRVPDWSGYFEQVEAVLDGLGEPVERAATRPPSAA